MHIWLQDFRYALRMLRKNAGVTLVMAASLAIGIGANSAIFSVVDALLLRPLPYPQPDRLAAIWLHSPGIGILRDWPSPGHYIDVRNENHSFDQMALAQSRSFTLTGREQPLRIDGMRTQSSLLRMLGAKPLLGRLLLPEEDQPGKPAVAILTDRIWKRLFNSDPAIVGKSITLNGNPFTVAGVIQRGFMLNAEVMPSEGPMDKVDLFLPLPLGADAVNRRGDENYNILVRLKPGVSVPQARVALGARPGDIIGLIVRHGMELAAIGILAGLAGAAALTRVMASLLFGVSATDAATFCAVAALLAAVAFAATVIPARRATRVDPMVALRQE